jgi:hypothetical protein
MKIWIATLGVLISTLFSNCESNKSKNENSGNHKTDSLETRDGKATTVETDTFGTNPNK